MLERSERQSLFSRFEDVVAHVYQRVTTIVKHEDGAERRLAKFRIFLRDHWRTHWSRGTLANALVAIFHNLSDLSSH